ncbi:hypothetical protein GLOTRDRAFT_5637, partial [Gloeophyllum trabeum ATCC 11539]
PHKCAVCGSTFTRKANLDGHLTAHKGEKPYPCDVGTCSKAFARLNDLKRHKKIHEKEGHPGERYKCQMCGSTFTRKANLDEHLTGRPLLIKPAPHKCAVCGSRFMRKVNLDEHLTAHKGEKPYPCDFGTCSKAFARLNDLNRHRKIHEKE